MFQTLVSEFGSIFASDDDDDEMVMVCEEPDPFLDHLRGPQQLMSLALRLSSSAVRLSSLSAVFAPLHPRMWGYPYGTLSSSTEARCDAAGTTMHIWQAGRLVMMMMMMI